MNKQILLGIFLGVAIAPAAVAIPVVSSLVEGVKETAADFKALCINGGKEGWGAVGIACAKRVPAVIIVELTSKLLRNETIHNKCKIGDVIVLNRVPNRVQKFVFKKLPRFGAAVEAVQDTKLPLVGKGLNIPIEVGLELLENVGSEAIIARFSRDGSEIQKRADRLVKRVAPFVWVAVRVFGPRAPMFKNFV